MVWKLLKQHISKAQLAGFFLANLCGTVIILLSVQFYQDVKPLFMGGDSFMSKDYIIVSKKVSALGSLVGRGTSFSEAEVDEMRAQPFAEAVGVFKPARFNVSAGMGLQGISFSTAMFFEAVPDAFLDVRPEEWKYEEGQEEIPIILPRNYLNLYNFGFAKSRSLPQLSEGMLGMVALDVRISGRGQVKLLKGRIVGFSNRLNTILVPESFIDLGNRLYGEDKELQTSRLIVEVDNPADERIVQFMQKNGYEVEGDKLDTGKTAWFLKLIIGVVISVGALISVLSLYILMLSIYLLLQKNTVKLENLLLIGYSPARVARPYQGLTVALNFVILALGLWAVKMIRDAYLDTLGALLPGAGDGNLWVAVGAGLVLFLFASLLNVWVIRHKINSIWKRE